MNHERDDREFLPAALEILERPPSPIALRLMLAICAFAVIALLWAGLGQTDIIAVAHGKVQPTGRVKPVQPLETGKVRKIFVQNGASVKAGDPLVELDPDEALAELRAAEASYVSWTAEHLRRRDGVFEAAVDGGVPSPGIPWPTFIPAAIRAREDPVRRSQVQKLHADLAAQEAQIAQKHAERRRLIDTIAAQKKLIETLQARVDLRTALAEAKFGTRTNLLDAEEALRNQRTGLADRSGQLQETERAIVTLGAERVKILQAFVAEHTEKSAEAQRQADEAEQRLARARLKLEHLVLRSPTDGTVQASSVTSPGQVITVGQEVMRVVPRDAPPEIEVYLENKDIGFVEAGQAASLKIEAFPFTRYGTVPARVERVARDAIPEPDARQIEGDPTRPVSTAAATGAERVRSLVFPVVLIGERAYVNADGRDVPLSPGMAVTAEIKTGRRSILDYLLSPVRETASEALHER